MNTPMHTDSALRRIKDGLIDLYLNNLDLIEEHSAPLLNQHRQEAIQHFRRQGIPDPQAEQYRYSKLEPIFDHPYEKYFAPKRTSLSPNDIFRCSLPNLQSLLALTLNGFHHPTDGQRLLTLPNGVIMGSLAHAATTHTQLIAAHYNTLVPNASDGLAALNTAMAQDGIFIYVPHGVVMEQPIQIINLLQADESQMVQLRNLIIVEESSHANILMCNHTLSPAAFLTNSVTEVAVATNAHLELVFMQNEHNQAAHIAHTHIAAQHNAQVHTNTLSLHGGFIRNNLRIALLGDGAHASAHGLLLADRQQHIDNATLIEHIAPNCTSHELYKGVLDDEATGAFGGTIMVNPNAQRTEAYQSCNNLLLTSRAAMNTKPQLEIYANDVRCSHGATVGQLNDEALFYLRSRGIDEHQAKLMLMFGFAHEVVQQISIEPLRQRIDELVQLRLNGELAHCHSCPVKHPTT